MYPVKRHRPDKELRRPGGSGEAPSGCKKSGGRGLGGLHTRHQSDPMPEMVRRDSGHSIHNTPKRTTIPRSDPSGNRDQKQKQKQKRESHAYVEATTQGTEKTLGDEKSRRFAEPRRGEGAPVAPARSRSAPFGRPTFSLRTKTSEL